MTSPALTHSSTGSTSSLKHPGIWHIGNNLCNSNLTTFIIEQNRTKSSAYILLKTRLQCSCRPEEDQLHFGALWSGGDII